MMEKQTDGQLGSNSYLEKLVGKKVKVYRGNPESQFGKLLEIKPDYVALLPENSNDSTIIYYHLRHVQNISENSKATPIQAHTDIDYHSELVSGSNFNELLKKLIKRMVKVNQGGPEAKMGRVLQVADDYLALLTEDDGLVFYSIYHIKSVSVQRSLQSTASTVQYDAIYDSQAQNFYDLLDDFTYRWITINRGGPEALEGVLVQKDRNQYTLVNNEEVIQIYPLHIKSISLGPKGLYKKQQNQDDESKEKKDGKDPEKNNAEAGKSVENRDKKSDKNKKEKNNKNQSETDQNGKSSKEDNETPTKENDRTTDNDESRNMEINEEKNSEIKRDNKSEIEQEQKPEKEDDQESDKEALRVQESEHEMDKVDEKKSDRGRGKKSDPEHKRKSEKKHGKKSEKEDYLKSDKDRDEKPVKEHGRKPRSEQDQSTDEEYILDGEPETNTDDDQAENSRVASSDNNMELDLDQERNENVPNTYQKTKIQYPKKRRDSQEQIVKTIDYVWNPKW